MSSSHPVHHTPAPWTTKSECYWLFLYLKDLPAGLYDPLEDKRFGDGNLSEEKEKLGEFKGGLGLVMIVRYADTPVGKFVLSLFPSIILTYLIFGRLLFVRSILANALRSVLCRQRCLLLNCQSLSFEFRVSSSKILVASTNEMLGHCRFSISI
jgi:hypothetical protein